MDETRIIEQKSISRIERGYSKIIKAVIMNVIGDTKKKMAVMM